MSSQITIEMCASTMACYRGLGRVTTGNPWQSLRYEISKKQLIKTLQDFTKTRSHWTSHGLINRSHLFFRTKYNHVGKVKRSFAYDCHTWETFHIKRKDLGKTIGLRSGGNGVRATFFTVGSVNCLNIVPRQTGINTHLIGSAVSKWALPGGHGHHSGSTQLHEGTALTHTTRDTLLTAESAVTHLGHLLM